jgi:hypothetical protein
VSERYSLDFDRSSGSFSVIPITNEQLTGYDDTITFGDRPGGVDSQITKTSDRKPICSAVNPLVFLLVEAAVGSR